MNDIGSQLRAAREAQDLSIEQAYKATRIKPAYIEALEANRLDTLPGLVQARGFVRSYANFLGLDGEAFAAGLETGEVVAAPSPAAAPEPISAEPDRPTAKPPVRSSEVLRTPSMTLSSSRSSASLTGGGIPTPVLIAGAVILFLIGAVLILSALAGGGAEPLPTPNVNVTLPMSAPIEANPLAAKLQSEASVSITLTTAEHVWVRVTTDGQTAFEGMLEPDTTQQWTAKQQVIVETGNAAAVTVTYRGRSSVVGNRGQVIARAWGVNGVEDVPVASSSTPTSFGSQATFISTSTQQP
jgi:cytoskeletal protein RodZ